MKDFKMNNVKSLGTVYIYIYIYIDILSKNKKYFSL